MLQLQRHFAQPDAARHAPIRSFRLDIFQRQILEQIAGVKLFGGPIDPQRRVILAALEKRQATAAQLFERINVDPAAARRVQAVIFARPQHRTGIPQRFAQHRHRMVQPGAFGPFGAILGPQQLTDLVSMGTLFAALQQIAEQGAGFLWGTSVDPPIDHSIADKDPKLAQSVDMPACRHRRTAQTGPRFGQP